MTKFFATLPALALIVALTGNALAEDGTVSETTLQEMGLAGMQVMSDEAALAIRGKGWQGQSHKKQVKPSSMAYGHSYANVGHEDVGAGTKDGYFAKGQYMAGGEHFSEAGKTVTKSHELQVKGLPATLEIKVKSVRVFAGGFATASSL